MNSQLRSNRIKALVIGTSLGIAWIAFVYASVQKTEANRQATLAIENERRALACENLTHDMNQKMARMVQDLQLALEESQQRIRTLEQQVVEERTKNKK